MFAKRKPQALPYYNLVENDEELNKISARLEINCPYELHLHQANFQKISGNAFKRFCDAIAKSTRLTSLLLPETLAGYKSMGELSKTQAETLLTAIGNNINITKLDLTDRLNSEGQQQAIAIARKHLAISSLSLTSQSQSPLQKELDTLKPIFVSRKQAQQQPENLLAKLNLAELFKVALSIHKKINKPGRRAYGQFNAQRWINEAISSHQSNIGKFNHFVTRLQNRSKAQKYSLVTAFGLFKKQITVHPLHHRSFETIVATLVKAKLEGKTITAKNATREMFTKENMATVSTLMNQLADQTSKLGVDVGQKLVFEIGR